MKIESLQVFNQQSFAFGLSWYAVVGQVETQQVQLLAKRQKASAWVVAGHTFYSLGFSYSVYKHKSPCYAAAVCFALMHPTGVKVAIYHHDDLGYWLVASQEGTPICHADQLFSDESEAKRAYIELTHGYPSLIDPPSVFPLSDFISALATCPIQKSVLQPRSSSKPWKRILLVGVLLAGASWYGVPDTVKAIEVEPESDPYFSYWQQQRLVASNQVALQALVSYWYQLPLVVANWKLEHVDCVVSSQTWRCSQHYKPGLVSATVSDFEQNKPSEWTIQNTELQQIVVQNTVPFIVDSEVVWRSKAQINVALLSQAQSIRSAFTTIRISDPQVFFHKSQSVVTKQIFSPIFTQKIQLVGPLRSMALLEDVDSALYWAKASLVIKEQAKSNLKNSVLQVTLQGDIYVRDE